jgi:hypothetical protein
LPREDSLILLGFSVHPPFLATRTFAGKELVAKTGLTGHPRTPPYTPVHARASTLKPQSVAIHLSLSPSRPPQPYTSVQGRAPPCMGVHGRACMGVHLCTSPYMAERAPPCRGVQGRTCPGVQGRAPPCTPVHPRTRASVHPRTWPYMAVHPRARKSGQGRACPYTPVQGSIGQAPHPHLSRSNAVLTL